MAWPNGASAALALTLDNMGEAADLDRGLWPDSHPVGSHFSVLQVLPRFLDILRRYDVSVTYFVEAWNLSTYPSAVANDLLKSGHEVAWHAWRHEAWAKLKNDAAEEANFSQSFSKDHLGRFIQQNGVDTTTATLYKGFRPPGGVIRDKSLSLCKQYGLDYISPAGQHAAIVKCRESAPVDSIVVLPFRWSTVDAYYYMQTFGPLRKLKGELPEEPQSSDKLASEFIKQIDSAISEGGYLSLLFHPFLDDDPGRLAAFESVVAYLARKRDEGMIWLARCCDVADWIQANPDIVGTDPGWDRAQWR